MRAAGLVERAMDRMWRRNRELVWRVSEHGYDEESFRLSALVKEAWALVTRLGQAAGAERERRGRAVVTKGGE